VPFPGALVALDQVLLVQRGEELDREEGIGAGLLRDERRERRGLRRSRAERVGDEAREILDGERADRYAGQPGACLVRRVHRRDERVRGRDLVVAVCADHEEEAHVVMGRQVLDEREAGRIGPLQVVEEERGGLSSRANAPMKRRSTARKRRCASRGGSSATGG
jgi:hypothetical protein